jgi:hypothetical protein
MDYSRIDIAAKARQWPMRCGELLRLGDNEGFVVRSALPKGKKMSTKEIKVFVD